MDGVGGKASIAYHRGLSFIKYLANARDRHSIHSPFLFDWYSRMLHHSFEESTEERDYLKMIQSSQYLLDRLDPGEGENRAIRVSRLFRRTKSSKRLLSFLDYIVYDKSSIRVLELGTCLESSTLRLSSNPQAELWTIEGDPSISDFLNSNFPKRKNIRLVPRSFSDVLPSVLDEM